MPGADVSIGLNGPRYSAGASGFMSQVSTCDAPPHRKNRIVERAFPPVGDGAAVSGPANPSPEATRNARRERGAAGEDTPGSGMGWR